MRVKHAGDPHEWEEKLKPGDYCLWDRERADGSRVWILCLPNGDRGAIDSKIWNITEHDDGEITASPSILVKPITDMMKGWHGYLEHGQWRPC